MMIVKLYLDVVNIQNCVTIQTLSDLVLYMVNDWQLQLSIEKCSMLHIGHC